MKKKYCVNCDTYGQAFKNYRTGLFKYNGETVLTCKNCGHLRTETEKRVPESLMIHKPTQTKYRDMDEYKKGDE